MSDGSPLGDALKTVDAAASQQLRSLAAAVPDPGSRAALMARQAAAKAATAAAAAALPPAVTQAAGAASQAIGTVTQAVGAATAVAGAAQAIAQNFSPTQDASSPDQSCCVAPPTVGPDNQPRPVTFAQFAQHVADTCGEAAFTKPLQQVFDEVYMCAKEVRPLPDTYMNPDYVAQHIASFAGGAARIGPNAPAPGSKIGYDETWVSVGASVKDSIVQAGGDPRKLENLLGLVPPGCLGADPVLVDIPELNGIKMPTGREYGANELWLPGGYTWPGGAKEVLLAPVQPGHYTHQPAFPKI